MEPILVAQSSSVAGNATMAPAAPPALAGAAGNATLLPATAGDGALLPAANATSIPGLGVPEPMTAWWGYFEALGWLCFALAALWLFLWLLKRRGALGLSGASVPDMRIESRLALGPKKWVIVTRHLDRRLILGVTEQQITLLSDRPAEEGKETPPGAQGGSFASFLKKEDRNPEG